MEEGILKGVRVLDLTRVLAGPYCSMLLADMGAEVIKIERPKIGDDSRAFGPFINGESAYYMNLNRNKKGMTLNLKSEQGRVIFLEMVKTADIVLENYRPGTMEKLHLSYEELKAVNPGIILGSVSGFGQYGPYHERPGYDIIAQSMGGLMSTTGWPGGAPTRSGTAMGDVLGGLGVTVGILAALHRKSVTGEGERVDVALVDSVVSSLEIITQIYFASGRIPERIGNRYESTYPYDSFQVKDGMAIIACGNDKLFRILLKEMGREELFEDERFHENKARIKNHALIKEMIEDWAKDKTVKELTDRLLELGIPAGPINNIDQLAQDPHIAGAREMFVKVHHPVAGETTLTGNHIKLTNHPAAIETPAPTLGQHTEEVLGQLLGYSKEEVQRLRKEGVL